jgi:hypothetical protein
VSAAERFRERYAKRRAHLRRLRRRFKERWRKKAKREGMAGFTPAERKRVREKRKRMAAADGSP